MQITIETVSTKKGLKEFVHFPNELYKKNPYYVPQLESMDYDTFDKKKNHAFEVCDAEYFLAKDEKGKVLGRVAAIINKAYNKKVDKKICRFGWIDFVENPEVAKALMNKVEEYAKSNGLNEIVGPEGFLEFDIAGVLVEGFDKLPTAYGKYNAPYYDKMITDLGYEKVVDWVEYLVNVPDEYPERYSKAAKLIEERYEVRQADIRSKKDAMKYVDGIFSVMNDCYSCIYGYTELTPGQLEDLKKQFIPNLNPDLLSVLLDKNDKVIGFSIWMPSFSKALQKAKGHLFPFGWFHILRALKHNDVADTLLIAIADEYKNKGLNALFFDKQWKGICKLGIKKLETTRELEINNNVQNLTGKLDRELIKRARAYKKSL